jgi:hypothetical protein
LCFFFLDLSDSELEDDESELDDLADLADLALLFSLAE